MKIIPTLEECKKIAAEGSYGVIPISTEMYADMTTPIEVLRILKKVSGHVYLLESAEADKRWGRYSFLGYDPLLEITCYNGMTTIKSELTSRTDSGDVRGIIRSVMEENKSPKLPGLPSFTGGLVGYFSYDYIKYSEQKLKLEDKEQQDFRDMDLMLFDQVIAFDHYRQKVLLIAGVMTDDLEASYQKAEGKLEETEWCSNSRERRGIFQNILHGDDYREMIQMMRSLYHQQERKRKTGHRLSSADVAAMHAAENRMYQEFGVVLNIRPEQVHNFILKRMEGSTAPAK